MRRLPSLTALRTFECAARHGHFGRAAAELCVTDSAVSHQIRQLEDQLGVALFERAGRQVRPTTEAKRLLHHLQQAFELIGKACDELRDPASQAVLRVAVTAELAQKWLVARLADFSSRYPHITLHLHEQPINAGLRLWISTSPSPTAPVRWMPAPTSYARCRCCSSSPCAARACSTKAGSSAHGTWYAIVCCTMIRTDALDHLAGHARRGRFAHPPAVLPHAALALEAAVLGQGVAMGDNLTCQADLQSGRLVRPFSASVTAQGQYALVCERLRLERGAVAEFIDWFTEQITEP